MSFMRSESIHLPSFFGSLFVCVFLLVLFPLDLFAVGPIAPVPGKELESAFLSVHNKLRILFTWIRNILFLVAGVAIIAVAASAYAGRFNIKWFITVVISVVLIAINGALTNYFVDTTSGAPYGVSTPTIEDALR